MRTTVTLEPDTEHLLREAARATNRSFKHVLNEAIRKGLNPGTQARVQVIPLFQHPFPPELESANFNQLSEELDDEETLRELVR